MSFSNVPLRNPGRYFEQFVKVVQPISGSGQQLPAATPTLQLWQLPAALLPTTAPTAR